MANGGVRTLSASNEDTKRVSIPQPIGPLPDESKQQEEAEDIVVVRMKTIHNTCQIYTSTRPRDRNNTSLLMHAAHNLM